MNKYMFISENSKNACVELSKFLRRLEICRPAFFWRANVTAVIDAKQKPHYRGNWIVSWPR